jgi:hypothetical protein
VDDDVRRRIVYGILSLVLGLLATRLAQYLTTKALGPAPEGREIW